MAAYAGVPVVLVCDARLTYIVRPSWLGSQWCGSGPTSIDAVANGNLLVSTVVTVLIVSAVI